MSKTALDNLCIDNLELCQHGTVLNDVEHFRSCSVQLTALLYDIITVFVFRFLLVSRLFNQEQLWLSC